MSPSVIRGIYWLGVVLMLLAIADSLLFRFARIDLTGVRWGSLALGGVGIVLMQVSRFIYVAPEPEPEDDGK
ncbi:hypothetical protein ETAA8_60220 [Anatilimnocola aggregata]|uniref:Uncharacterized protein n=1 Tax=Anatilimnocola aggregata TaxID=2528021 RepID=A0A517YKY5_9BACT|nr:hypothetical protein [Anatilimnocola aggregata]QDU30873.1 hypothetical protein ETAA8_60220 [Anatilimnocola aggregata]